MMGAITATCRHRVAMTATAAIDGVVPITCIQAMGEAESTGAAPKDEDKRLLTSPTDRRCRAHHLHPGDG